MIKTRDLINKLMDGDLEDQIYVFNKLTDKYYPVKKAIVDDEVVYLEIDKEIETYE